MSGATIGGVIGGAIGYFFGGPAGFQVGWMIGSAVGGYVDPDVIKGPKLTDAQDVRVQEGAPVPFGYGTFVVGGNVIQCGPLDEHKHRERTGKGGGPVQETFSYTRTVAIGLCEGEVGGILRIWADGKLMYDARDPAEWPDAADDIRAMAVDSAKFRTGFTFYPGSETQDPDPTLQALDTSWGGGYGNVPAYRGLAYVVFRDYDCTDRSGAIPQFRFEVACCGTTTATPHDTPWNHGYTGTGQSIFGASITQGDIIVSGWNNNLRRSIDGGKTWAALDYSSLGWNVGDPLEVVGSPNNYYLCKADRIATGDGNSWHDLQATVLPINIQIGQPGIFALASGYWAGATGSGNTKIFPLLTTNIGDVVDLGADYGHATCGVIAPVGATLIGTDAGKIVAVGGTVRFSGGAGTSVFSLCTDGSSIVLGAVSGAGYVYSNDSGATFTLYAGATVYGIVYARGVFYRVLLDRVQSSTDGLTWRDVDTYFAGRSGGSLIVTDGYSVAALTIDGFVASLATVYSLPDASGWYVDNDGNVTGATTYVTSRCNAVLSDVVSDLCDRVGVAADRIDVSQLTDSVRGFLVGKQGAAADNIRALQQGYFFDFPEWGDSSDTFTKLRAIKRGAPTLFTVTDDDLVASDDDQDTRGQAVEFPRKLHLITADVDADYNPTTQTAERQTEDVKAVGEMSVELALSSTRSEAVQRADKMLKIAWEEATGTWERELPENFSVYTPSDCFTHNGKRWRIQTTELGDGTVKVKAVRDRPSAYTSAATASTPLRPAPPTLGIRGPTVFAGMNLPSLRTADNTTGMYVAVCGLLSGWQGCDLQMSLDGGTTYLSAGQITSETTMGYLTAPCGTTGDITAKVLHNHTLESVTAAQLAARANAFAITSSNVSEIGQFQTATDTANLGEYTLSDNTRGELGTTAAAHNLGDRFVLLDYVTFVPIDATYAGRTIYFRPVSLGTIPENNAVYPVVFQPLFTSAATVDFLETELGEVITTETGDYLQLDIAA
jgi:hypothetical protein